MFAVYVVICTSNPRTVGLQVVCIRILLVNALEQVQSKHRVETCTPGSIAWRPCPSRQRCLNVPIWCCVQDVLEVYGERYVQRTTTNKKHTPIGSHSAVLDRPPPDLYKRTVPPKLQGACCLLANVAEPKLRPMPSVLGGAQWTRRLGHTTHPHPHAWELGIKPHVVDAPQYFHITWWTASV